MAFPKYLYKYYKFDEYWYSNIIEGNVFLNTPDNFNDPYDVNIAGLEEALLGNLRVKCGYGYINLDDYFPMRDGKISSFYEYKNVILKDLKQKFLISSFSERMDSTPMWAHYSDMHRGYLIKYDMSRLSNQELMNIRKVNYSDEAILCGTDYLLNEEPVFKNGKGPLDIILQKSRDWSYEQEWRYSKFNESNRYVDFSKSIVGVYFGVDFHKMCHQRELGKIFDKYSNSDCMIGQMRRSDKTLRFEHEDFATLSDFLTR